jgi:RNase adapter protein RapZ
MTAEDGTTGDRRRPGRDRRNADTGRSTVGPDRGALETLIVTGLSGAGRTTAAKCLEDLGFFVVDNLPPELVATMVDLGSRSQGAVTRIAVVMDVRSRAFSTDLTGVVRALSERGLSPRVVFLEASDTTLIRRFENNRRAHPLQGDGRLADGITAERKLLQPLRDIADLVVDTSDRSVHELRRVLEQAFLSDGAGAPELRAAVVSFGFKYGLPVDADLVIDVRFLPNPYWIPELRDQTGEDDEVRDYVLSQELAMEFLDRYVEILKMIGAGYRREGKHYLTLAVGCTGGKHRSVVMSRELASRLDELGIRATAVHRDLGRE